jgi:hypothetical protein
LNKDQRTAHPRTMTHEQMAANRSGLTSTNRTDRKKKFINTCTISEK